MVTKDQGLRIAALLPHTKLYGGVKRFLELGNQFVIKGHQMTVLTPSGEEPGWFRFSGKIKPISHLCDESYHVVFFTELSLLDYVLKANAERKIYYIVNPSVRLNKISIHREIEFFANSSNLLERAEKKYGIKAFPALGGLNLKNFPKKEPKPLHPSDAFTVMAYGRIAEGRKGTMFVVRACERLQRKGYHVKLLLFDTPVTDNIRKALDKFRTTLPFEFVLNHPVEKNVELYHRADIFVAPEKKTGYANTVVEAMASGTLVVATSSGTKDLLVDGVTGIKVTRNVHKISNAILRLLNDHELCISLTENARKMVEKLDWSLLADSIIKNLYEHVSAKKPEKSE